MPRKRKDRISIRPICRQDIAQSLSPADFLDWNGPSVSWTAQELLGQTQLPNREVWVAEVNRERVVAFMVYQRNDERLELVSLMVKVDYRRKGVGRKLVAKLMGRCGQYHKTHATAKVSEDDINSQLFLKSTGWTGRIEDGVMVFEIVKATASKSV